MYRNRVFSSRKHWKWTYWNTRQKSTELTIPLKFELGTIVRLHVCSNHHGKMMLCRFQTSHHENISKHKNWFLYCLVRQNKHCPKIAFSGQQNAENEHNETLNKRYRTDYSFKISIKIVLRLHVCSNQHAIMRHCKFLHHIIK